MNKRIRKKKFQGEFRYRYFEVAFIPAEGLTQEKMEAFVARALVWGTERGGLWFGFGFSSDEDDIVRTIPSALVSRYSPRRKSKKRFPNASVFPVDRAAVLGWLKEQPEVREAWVGSLIENDDADWEPEVGPEDETLPVMEN